MSSSLKEHDRTFICAAGPAAGVFQYNIFQILWMKNLNQRWAICPATGYKTAVCDGALSFWV
jgi:hypothetical protein